MIFDHSSEASMASTDFESPIQLLRQLRQPLYVTTETRGIFREKRHNIKSRGYCDLDSIINTLDNCVEDLGKITTLVEELGLSGRGFPVSLRMQICDELVPYNNFWLSQNITADRAESTLDTLQKIYDDLSLHACVDLKNNMSTLEQILADNAMTELVELASMFDCRGVQSYLISTQPSP